MRLILDVDPGVDDAMAIVFALQSPQLEVLGLSVVSGNVPVEQGVRNALDLLQFIGRGEIPVYQGAAAPLTRESVHAFEVHGGTGLGEACLPESTLRQCGDAIEFIIGSLTAAEDAITLVALGPLTNLALAEERRPGILRRARQLIIMGSCLAVPGNVSPVSEFNFFVDPDAADRVIRSGANLVLIPLDVTRQAVDDRAGIAVKMQEYNSAMSAFYEAATRSTLARMEALYGRAQFYLHDPMAVGFALNSTWFRVESLWLAVETNASLTRGQIVVDRRPYVSERRNLGSRVKCAIGVDSAAFMNEFTQATLDPGRARV